MRGAPLLRRPHRGADRRGPRHLAGLGEATPPPGHAEPDRASGGSGMKDDRTYDETERRLRDALSSKASGVSPGEGWTTIVERLDGRPSPWMWITQHPLVIGAAVALVALLAVLTVNLHTGDEQAGDV